MNLDESYIDPYMEDWLQYIIKDNNQLQEEIRNPEKQYFPYSGLPETMVKIMFWMSTHLALDTHGKYLAVHILDRFMFYNFREMVGTMSKSEISKKLSSQLKLWVISCIQLASKMDFWKSALMIEQAQEVLRIIDPGQKYTKSDILKSEIKVYQTINFQMPLSSPIQVIEVLLAIINLRDLPQVYETCVQLLDVSYLQHRQIYNQLYELVHGKNYDRCDPDNCNFLALEANTMFISGAIIICSSFFFNLKRNLVKDLSENLGKLTQTDPIELNIMANVLFNCAMPAAYFAELARECGITPPNQNTNRQK